MEERTPQITVHLVRADSHHLSVFQLKDASKLPNGFGQAAHIPNADGSLIPVPYGSIENYARHLAELWEDEDAYVMLVVTTSFCESTDAVVEPNPETLTGEFRQYIDKLPEEQKRRISPSLIPDPTTPPDETKNEQPNNC